MLGAYDEPYTRFRQPKRVSFIKNKQYVRLLPPVALTTANGKKRIDPLMML